jgi:porin
VGLALSFLLSAFRAEAAGNPAVYEKGAGTVPWINRETATGDWGGLRDELEKAGLKFSCNYTIDIAGNPVGGYKNRTTSAAFLNVGVVMDLEKIASLKGTTLTVNNYLAMGKNLSDSVGNYFGVQEIYTSGNYYFGQMNLAVSMLEDTLILETGRLFAADEFATSDLWQYYLNAGINDNLNSLHANIFFPSFNIAAWAVRARYEPDEKWQLITGIYNADPRVGRKEAHGADFSFDMDKGYLALGQLKYRYGQDNNSEVLPGSVSFGAYYESSTFPELNDPRRSKKGKYGFCAVGEQTIFLDRRKENNKRSYDELTGKQHYPQHALASHPIRGLTAWAGGYLAPGEKVNAQTYQIAWGMVYKGLSPGRPFDTTAFCCLFAKFSDKLPAQEMETLLELNHRFRMSRWFYVTPGVQYIIDPKGRDDIDDALVLILELSVNF